MFKSRVPFSHGRFTSDVGFAQPGRGSCPASALSTQRSSVNDSFLSSIPAFI